MADDNTEKLKEFIKSPEDLKKFLDIIGKPEDLNALQARLETKAFAMKHGFAPPQPPVQEVKDPMRTTHMDKVGDLFDKVKEVKDRFGPNSPQEVEAGMAQSTMYKQALSEKHKDGKSFSVAEKRELGREIDMYRVQHGDIEEKLSVLMLKFDNAKMVAGKRAELDVNADRLTSANLPIPEKMQNIINEGAQLASYTMQDLQEILPAANITKEREEFVNYGTPGEVQQAQHAGLFDKIVKSKEAMAEFRKQYIANGEESEKDERGKEFDKLVAEKKTPQLKEHFIKLGTPSEKTKEARGKLFDEAMQEIRDYGKDLGREAEMEKLLVPEIKESALKAVENNVAINTQHVNPTQIRNGIAPSGPKGVA